MVSTAAPLELQSSLLERWRSLSLLPLGRALFAQAVGRAMPYAATITPEVLDLDVGRARVRLDDRQRVRNHLGSIHSAALVNLGELCANLALTAAMPEGARFVVEGIGIAFAKKARGPIEARCELPPLDWSCERRVPGAAVLTDRAGEEVARVTVDFWIVPAPG